MPEKKMYEKKIMRDKNISAAPQSEKKTFDYEKSHSPSLPFKLNGWSLDIYSLSYWSLFAYTSLYCMGMAHAKRATPKH